MEDKEKEEEPEDENVEAIKIPEGILPPGLGGAILKVPNKREPSLASHYGVKDKEFHENTVDILCDLLKSKNFATVIDKHFPKLSGDDRVKVMSFAFAMQDLEKLRGDNYRC